MPKWVIVSGLLLALITIDIVTAYLWAYMFPINTPSAIMATLIALQMVIINIMVSYLCFLVGKS